MFHKKNYLVQGKGKGESAHAVLNRIHSALLLSLLATASPTWAVLTPELSSEQPIEFDAQTQTLTARGDARLVHEDLLFEADEIQWRQRDSHVAAEGNIHLTKQSFRLVADRIDYHLPTHRFDIGDFRLGEVPLYVIGSSLEGSIDAVTLWGDTLYLHEPDTFSLNLKSHSTQFYPNNRVEMRHVVFRIGKVPFFYLPYYRQELLKSTIQIQTEAGYRGNLGAYAKTRTLFPVNESLKVGANLDYYIKRGILAGPALEYDVTLAPGYTLHGELESGYINDHGDKGEDLLNNPVPEERAFVEWKHKQHIGQWADITARLSYWSDSEVERDFRPKLFRHNQQPDTFLEAVHTGNNSFASVFGRFRPNNFQSLNERLPEVRFDSMPSPLGSKGLYQRFHIAYAHLIEKRLNNGLETIRSDRFNGFYQILHPIRATEWLTLTPSTGVQLTHYANALGSQYTRLLAQFGLDAEMTASSTWDYNNRLWKIDGLRHTVRPVLRYRYIPKANQGHKRIPQIDDEVFSTTLPLIDLGEIRSIDDLRETHLIRLGIENFLQTRRTDYGSRQLTTFDLYQDIRISREHSEKTFSDLYTDLKVMPVDWFRFRLFNRFNPEDLTFNETRTTIAVNDGDIWALSLTTDNLQKQIDQYGLGFDYKLNERWLFNSHWRYDTRLSAFTRHAYGLTTYIGNSWKAAFELAFNEGSSREDQAQLNLRLKLLGL